VHVLLGAGAAAVASEVSGTCCAACSMHSLLLVCAYAIHLCQQHQRHLYLFLNCTCSICAACLPCAPITPSHRPPLTSSSTQHALAFVISCCCTHLNHSYSCPCCVALPPVPPPPPCAQTVANRLGLSHHPIRGSAVTPTLHGGRTLPLRALTEPLTIQLLAGPGNVACLLTFIVVLVVPSTSNAENDIFELQLGLFDFCQEVDHDCLPLWASQFTDRASGYRWALPVVVPQPRQHQLRSTGTSTFHITQECYAEVRE
jgi:hypothetical protein